MSREVRRTCQKNDRWAHRRLGLEEHQDRVLVSTNDELEGGMRINADSSPILLLTEFTRHVRTVNTQ